MPKLQEISSIMTDPIRALIIEDELPAARRLKRLLQDLPHAIEIIDILESVEQAVAWFQQHQADLVFLDIHLGDGISFSIFDQVSVPGPIIFTTAYDQYAIRAFKLNSLDYLLKPVDPDELTAAVAKYEARQVSPPTIDVQALLQAMQPVQTYQKRFMVNTGDKIRSIPTEEVAYFFGQQKYVFLITQDGRRHLIDLTLTQLENLLDPETFFRINRQFIVAFPAIQQMFSYSKSRIKIELAPKPDMDAIVSIEKTPRFKAWLNR